jgi:ElaB/YqjD/DUF883 family membrane-anchored ribosome-binding protein
MADTREWVKDRIDTGADKAKQLTEQAGQAARSAADKAKEMAGSVAGAVGEVKDKAKEWTTQAGHGISQAAGSVRDTAVHAYDASCEATKEAGRELTNFVRRYPIASLMIGLGLGFLVGRAARRVL